MTRRAAALALMGLAPAARAVFLKDQSRELGGSGALVDVLRHKALARFGHVDTDDDGVVSFEEMKRGFGHEPGRVGEGILREMLAECAGTDAAESCTRDQLELALERWVSSGMAKESLSLLETDSQHGFVQVEKHRHYRSRTTSKQGLDLDHEAPEPCGPTAAEKKGAGFENVVCHVEGAKCVKRGSLVAWSYDDVCKGRACICEATPETKRLAKVGLAGAAAVTTAKNFTDPHDEMRNPECGGDWQGWKIVGRMDHLDKVFSGTETVFAKAMLKIFSPSTVEHWDKENFVDTEVALFKTSTHELVKGRHDGKVCMMSWQATRSSGDWKLNTLMRDIPFKYAQGAKAPKGLVLSYDSVRPLLLDALERECCRPDWQADKIIISGHSHGGAMASLHALDVVTNWKCNGRDIGANDMAVILVAPHSNMYGQDIVNHVWSCNDPATCLAGRAAVLSTRGDYVADRSHGLKKGGFPSHPSTVYKLPCPAVPEGANPREEPHYKEFWCHGMYNYVAVVEQELVDKAGWGSTCGGECGHPNRMVQCNQWVIMGATGCSYAKPEYLKNYTRCDSKKAWIPGREVCDCHFDKCTELTTVGCES